ncbi:MAG: tetratricopeptide repeat protein [Proteobacteria bacterium]|nr:tetratricopeptide repeat protein [Pseudomonadota bacterium]
MKRWISAIVGVIFVALPFVAESGQKDTRLDGLFARLQATRDGVEAQVVEQMIWKIWTEIDDPASDSLMRIGLEAMQGGDLPGALALFDAVTARSPNFAEGWNKRATVFYLLGAYDASAKDVERTLALEPRHFGALAGLGLINVAREHQTEALNAFEQALKINPHMPGVKANIESLKKNKRDKDI